MAKNLLDQIISLASGSKWTKEQSENFEQSEASQGLSGVEKYLQRKSVSTLTGVARYLERKTKEQADRIAIQTAAEEVEAVTEIEESSVEKYLRRKAGSVQERPVVKKRLSRVERYLQQKEQTQGEPAAPVAKPAKPVSSVEKYLKSHETTSAKKTTVQPEKKPSKAKVQQKATRCQAATSKGKQCSRTSNTTKIQRTINKKKYHFTVCSQHNNDSFKPFPDFVDND
jgi:hypothetical protein